MTSCYLVKLLSLKLKLFFGGLTIFATYLAKRLISLRLIFSFLEMSMLMLGKELLRKVVPFICMDKSSHIICKIEESNSWKPMRMGKNDP